MNYATWFKQDTWQLDRPVWLIIVFTFGAVAWIMSTAWASGGATAVLVIAPAAVMMANGHSLEFASPGPVVRVALLCWLYVLVSALWAADLAWSGKVLLISGGLLAGLYLASRTYPAMPLPWLEHMTRAVLVSFVVFLVYGLIEETFDHPIKRMLFWPFQAVRIEDGWPMLDWNHVAKVRAYRTNWNMTNMALLLWPVLLIARGQLDERDRKWFMPLLLAAALATVLQSEHETAMIAIMLGCLWFILAWFHLRTALLLAGVGWLAAIVAVVPLSQLAFDNKMHRASWLPSTAQHRIVLWKYTADQIPHRPVFGVGAGSTHPLDARRTNGVELIPGTRYELRTGSHPHNIYIQVWYEFGAVGAFLFLILGWAVLWSTERLPRAHRPYYVAAFVTAAANSASSFGLFELWYAGALTASAILLTMATTYVSRTDVAGR